MQLLGAKTSLDDIGAVFGIHFSTPLDVVGVRVTFNSPLRVKGRRLKAEFAKRALGEYEYVNP